MSSPALAICADREQPKKAITSTDKIVGILFSIFSSFNILALSF
jgi:hypothetical protein